MKDMKKIMSLLLTMALLVVMGSVVFASNPIKDNGLEPGNVTITTEASNAVGKVLGFIQYIGYAVAVGMLLYIGIKYMMASAADKADLKKGAINYVIGAVLIGGASAVAGFLVHILG